MNSETGLVDFDVSITCAYAATVRSLCCDIVIFHMQTPIGLHFSVLHSFVCGVDTLANTISSLLSSTRLVEYR